MNQEQLDALLDEFQELALIGQSNNFKFRNQDFSGLSFGGRTLQGIDLRRSNLSGCDFTNCVLTGAKFMLSTLDDADFTGADISNSNFDKATIVNTQFVGAIWEGVTITVAETTAENRLTNIITNAFSQLGCLQKSNLEWLILTPQDRAILYPEDPVMIESFWSNVKPTIEAIQ